MQRICLFLLVTCFAAQAAFSKTDIYVGTAKENKTHLALKFVMDDEGFLRGRELSLQHPGENIRYILTGHSCFFERGYHCFSGRNFSVVLAVRTEEDFNFDYFARLLVDAYEAIVKKPKRLAPSYNVAVAFVDDSTSLIRVDSAHLSHVTTNSLEDIELPLEN